MNTTGMPNDTRRAATSGLAVVGFVALVAAGMWLAVYSARYVPSAVGRIGSAAVYLGSLFSPSSDGPSLSVIPTASTTIPFGGATSTPATSTPATKPTQPSKPSTPATTPGQQTSSATQIGGSTGSPTLYGQADLAVNIDRIGYLATTSAESFVASSTVPSGSRPAIVFTVKNVGTNVSAPWSFTATIPTATSYVYTAPLQQALRPGESIQFTLGFDQANKGSNQKISIHVNPNGADAAAANNDSFATLTILGN